LTAVRTQAGMGACSLPQGPLLCYLSLHHPAQLKSMLRLQLYALCFFAWLSVSVVRVGFAVVAVCLVALIKDGDVSTD
jgi:hypothetical protein